MQMAVEKRAEIPSPTSAIARFASTLRFEDIPEAARHAARRHTLDTIGAIVAGSRQHATEAVLATLRELASGGPVPVPGLADRFDPLSAAYVMGTAAHGLELDDGYRAGSVHPGTVIVPTLLAATATGNYNGRDWMRATVVGYEIVCRLAGAMHPASRQRGWHNTPVMGVMGAAAAVGALLGLDEKRIANALGLAASSAAGIHAFLRGGGEVKRVHPGHAAREGLQCAVMAKNGLIGPVDVLEIEEGYFESFSENVDPAKVTDGLGEDFLAARCYIKPYACCRHLHPGIDAVLDILGQEGVEAEAIEWVDIATYAIAVKHGQPKYDDMLSAQMSYPFALATALARRAVNLDHFDEAARADERVLRHLPKIRVVRDEEADANYPRLRTAKVAVTTRDGRTLRRTVEEPYGGAANPLSDEALATKFHSLADPVIGKEAADEAERRLWAMQDEKRIVNLSTLLAGR